MVPGHHRGDPGGQQSAEGGRGQRAQGAAQGDKGAHWQQVTALKHASNTASYEQPNTRWPQPLLVYKSTTTGREGQQVCVSSLLSNCCLHTCCAPLLLIAHLTPQHQLKASAFLEHLKLMLILLPLLVHRG